MNEAGVKKLHCNEVHMFSIDGRVRNLSVAAVVLAITLTPALSFGLGGTGWVTITELTLYRGSVRAGALIQFSQGTPNLEGCSFQPSVGNTVLIDWSAAETPDGKALYSTALAAHLAGRTVSIGTNGCSSEGFPLVYAINVK